MAYLELHSVQKKFGATTAVESVDLQMERGEFVSFLGPSGCGKTTTLRMVAGFETPSSGRILLNGVDVTQVPPNKRNVGMLFQSYALFPNMTVADNIGFGLRITHHPPGQIRERVAEMLALIKMTAFDNRYPYQLSGGQQQRVALARALAIQPHVLLLDEPLSALDARIRVSLRYEIRAIQRQLRITTIYVTHDQEEALSLSDRVVVMNEGRVEQIGSPFDIYNFPATRFVASFVGTLNVIEAEVCDRVDGLLSVDKQMIRTTCHLNGAANGDKIPVAVRPERISLANGPAEANVLRGTVADVAFLGAVVRIQVSTGENCFYLDTFNNPYLAVTTPGQPVRVTFPPEAVLTLNHNEKPRG
ncbi:MAG TPA: ABC transporter ATP-binding protein [Anaerolineae bacterium]